MKQFLRYQVSGITFILWCAFYYFSTNDCNILTTVRYIVKHESLDKRVAFIIVAAIPIGVIIHQISVLIKNWCVAKFFKEFDDFPKVCQIQKNQTIHENIKYCLEKISNLNSFYYVRFDNGVLAPLFAIVFMWFSTGLFKTNVIILFLIIAILTSIYIIRIKKELKVYQEIISCEKKQ